MIKYTVRIFKNIQDMNNPAYAVLTIVTHNDLMTSHTGGWCVISKNGSYLFPKETLMTVTVEEE